MQAMDYSAQKWASPAPSPKQLGYSNFVINYVTHIERHIRAHLDLINKSCSFTNCLASCLKGY